MAEATSINNEENVGEELEKLSLGTRSRKVSRMLNQGELRSERARELKYRKSGHLGDIKQKIERV